MIARLDKGKTGSKKPPSHKTAKIVVLLVLCAAVGVMAVLARDILIIGRDKKAASHSELVFSGELAREDLRLDKADLKRLGGIERGYGDVFKRVEINAEVYSNSRVNPAAPDTPIIFWLTITTRTGKTLKPMRTKTTRKEFFEKLDRTLDDQRESLDMAVRREAVTKGTVKAVHGD